MICPPPSFLFCQIATSGLLVKQSTHHQTLLMPQARHKMIFKKTLVADTNKPTQQSICVCVCVRAQTPPTWHRMTRWHCGGAAEAPARQRFMPTGVCWNPGCLVQPSCMEDKTRGPAADISMGAPPTPLLPPSPPPSTTTLTHLPLTPLLCHMARVPLCFAPLLC